MASNTPKSPYSDVSDREWTQAYEEACDRIWAFEEGSEREPTETEINHALSVLREAKREEK